MKLGLIVTITGKTDIDARFRMLRENGFDTCQLCSWNAELYTDSAVQAVRTAMQKYGIEVTAVWCGWSGPQVWDFYNGPKTLGIVPKDLRAQRVEEIKRGSDFAAKLGICDIVTHAGFLPENPDTDEYREVVEALRDIVLYAKANGQYFLFETGQETPVTLLRTISDIGTDNLGINLDCANLVMYGKANPIDALGMFGTLVRGVHAKDALYPTDGKNLGNEVRIGDGVVNFAQIIKTLVQNGYNGAITIEREITGTELMQDIQHSRDYLAELIDNSSN